MRAGNQEEPGQSVAFFLDLDGLDHPGETLDIELLAHADEILGRDPAWDVLARKLHVPRVRWHFRRRIRPDGSGRWVGGKLSRLPLEHGDHARIRLARPNPERRRTVTDELPALGAQFVQPLLEQLHLDIVTLSKSDRFRCMAQELHVVLPARGLLRGSLPLRRTHRRCRIGGGLVEQAYQYFGLLREPALACTILIGQRSHPCPFRTPCTSLTVADDCTCSKPWDSFVPNASLLAWAPSRGVAQPG